MPTEISTWTQLRGIDSVGGRSGNFILVNDLDKDTADYSTVASSTANSGAGFLPIARASNQLFTGTLDGNGFAIKDMVINRATEAHGSIFGYGGNNFVIKNLRVENCSFTNSQSGSAGIISYVSGTGGLIENCHFQGSLTAVHYIGGMAGYVWGGCSVKKCSADVVINGSYSVAGIVGHAEGTGVTMEECFAKVDINGDVQVGGLIGQFMGGSISNCYSYGSVVSSSDQNRRGGAIGNNGKRPMTNCYSYASVAPLLGVNGGGFLGSKDTASPYADNDNFWDTQVSGWGSSEAGTGKTTSEMKQKATFTNWSIADKDSLNDEVWYIQEGQDYPRLAWELSGDSVVPSGVKIYQNSEWVDAKLKRYTGTEWLDATVKRREGSEWVT